MPMVILLDSSGIEHASYGRFRLGQEQIFCAVMGQARERDGSNTGLYIDQVTSKF